MNPCMTNLAFLLGNIASSIMFVVQYELASDYVCMVLKFH